MPIQRSKGFGHLKKKETIQIEELLIEGKSNFLATPMLTWEYFYTADL